LFVYEFNSWALSCWSGYLSRRLLLEHLLNLADLLLHRARNLLILTLSFKIWVFGHSPGLFFDLAFGFVELTLKFIFCTAFHGSLSSFLVRRKIACQVLDSVTRVIAGRQRSLRFEHAPGFVFSLGSGAVHGYKRRP